MTLSAQGTSSQLSKFGVIVFEKEQSSTGLYFIESDKHDDLFPFRQRDTIKVIGIGTPGDNANDVLGYKHYLDTKIIFDTLKCIAIIENEKGLHIEDSCTLSYAKGYIYFLKSNGYKLQRKYEKRKINGKIIVYQSDYYIPINSFQIARKRTRKRPA